jgi:8-oxo-dGTP diphosphatase
MAHIHELIDFTVMPFVLHPDGTKILLVFHPKYGRWMSIGGHIELDENPDQSLLKEINEECGLDVTVLSEKPDVKGAGYEVLWRPASVNIHDANAPHRHIGLVYYCLAHSADFRLSEEHTEMRWCTLDEMEDSELDVSPMTKYYARQAIEYYEKWQKKET